MFQSGWSFRIVICQLVNSHDLPITREHQESKENRSNDSHCKHITTPKEESVIELDVDNLNVNQHNFFVYLNGDIRENALWLRNMPNVSMWLRNMPIVSMKGGC